MARILSVRLPGQELNIGQLYLCTAAPVAASSVLSAAQYACCCFANTSPVFGTYLVDKDVDLSQLLWHMLTSAHDAAAKMRIACKLHRL